MRKRMARSGSAAASQAGSRSRSASGALPSASAAMPRSASGPVNGPHSNVTNPVLPALPINGLTRAPYAYRPTLAPPWAPWRRSMARHWVTWHIAIALASLAGAAAAALAGVGSELIIGLACLALGGVVLCAAALHALELDAPGAAVVLMFINDICVTLAALFLLGPQAEILALLPGALLLTALLVDFVVVMSGGFICLAVYLVALFQGSPARILLNSPSLLVTHVALLLSGGILFLAAIALVATQLRRALAGEAALDHALQTATRRARHKRAIIDADAVALQTSLAKTLRGATVQPVATCEDLAPLANMINAITARLPGLLRDREERLRLERAVRSVNEALERALAGFEWSWPSSSGTTVDYLIALIRSPGQIRE